MEMSQLGLKKMIFDPLSFLKWRNPRAFFVRFRSGTSSNEMDCNVFCCLNPSETEDEAMNIMNQKNWFSQGF